MAKLAIFNVVVVSKNLLRVKFFLGYFVLLAFIAILVESSILRQKFHKRLESQLCMVCRYCYVRFRGECSKELILRAITLLKSFFLTRKNRQIIYLVVNVIFT